MLIAALLAASWLPALTRLGWPRQPDAWVDLTEPEADGTGAPAGGVLPFRFAVAPVLGPEQSLEKFGPLVDYLAARLGRTPMLLQRRNYAEVNELLRNQHCEAALVCTYPLVRGEREFGLQPLAVPQIKGAVTFQSLAVVSSASPVASLLGLQGKRFASADLFSTAGWLYPAVWLKNHGVDANRFFLEHLITGSDDRSLQAVAAGYVDGTAVNSVVFDQVVGADPALAAKLKVILRSPPLGLPPVVVPPHTSVEVRQALLAALLAAHEGPAGKAALAGLGIDRFVVPDETLYDGVRKAVELWESRGP